VSCAMATGATGRSVQPAQPLYFVAVASKQAISLLMRGIGGNQPAIKNSAR
jgi:hypothetical protein